MRKLINFHIILSKCAIALAILLTFAAGAQAATRLVATTGTDSGTCTASACLTLMYAHGQASNGDTINVSTGTYAENDAVNHCFTPTKQLTWNAIDGVGTVVVRGTGSTWAARIESSTSSFTGFVFDGESARHPARFQAINNVSFTDCTFKDGAAASYLIIWAGTITGPVTLTRPIFTSAGAVTAIHQFADTGGVTITDATANLSVSTAGHVSNAAQDDLTINGGTYNITYTASTARFMQYYGTGNVTVNGITYTGVGSHYGFFYVQNANTGTFTFTNNNISFSTALSAGDLGKLFDIGTGVHPVTISNNIITSTGAGMARPFVILPGQTPVVISGNTFNISNTTAVSLAVIQIYAASAAQSVSITNNTIYTTHEQGYAILVGADADVASISYYSDGAVITGNRIYGPAYYNAEKSAVTIHGILYGFQKDGTISNNLVHGCGYGILSKGDGTAWASGNISHNILINNLTSSGIRLKGSEAVPIYNNTIYYSSAPNVGFSGGIHITENSDDAGTQASDNAIVKNNIVLVPAGYNNISVDADSASGFVSDNNLYYSTDGTLKFTLGAGTSTTLADWRTATSQEASSKSGDPLINTISWNIPGNSPAAKTGVPILTYAEWIAAGGDFYGKNPTGGTFSMGAVQWQKRIFEDDDILTIKSKSTDAGSYVQE